MGIAIVFPDTSPRGVDEACPEAGDADWTKGYGAGHYCNATQAPWSSHFNMYDYVTVELPNLIERYFPVCSERRSVTGFSMGGNGALILAAKLPERFRSATAISPISWPTHSEFFCKTAYEAFFGSVEAGTEYSAVDIINNKGANLTLPPGFVDTASADQFQHCLNWADLTRALKTNGHDWEIRSHEGYDHSFFFVSTVIEEHIN